MSLPVRLPLTLFILIAAIVGCSTLAADASAWSWFSSKTPVTTAPSDARPEVKTPEAQGHDAQAELIQALQRQPLPKIKDAVWLDANRRGSFGTVDVDLVSESQQHPGLTQLDDQFNPGRTLAVLLSEPRVIAPQPMYLNERHGAAFELPDTALSIRIGAVYLRRCCFRTNEIKNFVIRIFHSEQKPGARVTDHTVSPDQFTPYNEHV